MSILSRRQGQFPYRPQLDRGHPLCNGLIGAWSGAYGLSGPGNRYTIAPELVRNLNNDSLRQDGTLTSVSGFTAAGLSINTFAITFDGFVGPSAIFKRTDRISQFWYGVINSATPGANNPMIAGMYHSQLNLAPFHSWGIYRPNTSDIQFSYNNAGTFGSVLATNVIPAINIPVSFSATYGVSAVKGYRNGIEIASGSGISGITYDANCKFGVDFHAASGTVAGVSTALVLVYDRELNPTEHMALAIDPFQIFVKQNPQWWAVGDIPPTATEKTQFMIIMP